MSIYFEKLLDLYQSGKALEYMACYEMWGRKMLISKKEFMTLKYITPPWFENLKGDFDLNNRDIMTRFLSKLQDIKNIDCETLCSELRIRKEEMERLKEGRRMKSKKAVNKIVSEYFRLLRNQRQEMK